MQLRNLTVDPSGYLIDPATRERVVFYECDPLKNVLCTKVMCRGCTGPGDSEIGFCSSTPEPAFAKEGSRRFYKRLNEDGYFGREYLTGGGASHDDQG